jgi:hypothetical protein
VLLPPSDIPPSASPPCARPRCILNPDLGRDEKTGQECLSEVAMGRRTPCRAGRRPSPGRRPASQSRPASCVVSSLAKVDAKGSGLKSGPCTAVVESGWNGKASVDGRERWFEERGREGGASERARRLARRDTGGPTGRVDRGRRRAQQPSRRARMQAACTLMIKATDRVGIQPS